MKMVWLQFSPVIAAACATLACSEASAGDMQSGGRQSPPDGGVPGGAPLRGYH
jgi:hypothetical protein